MAVAFSTGGSGYTRSDFMISDAAIPARVEEAAKADQKEQFSQVLSGVSSSKNPADTAKASGQAAVTEKPEMSDKASVSGGTARYERFESLRAELTKPNGKLDLRKLVNAIAEGRITFAEIPQEYITTALLTELVKSAKNVEDAEKSDKDDAPLQNNDPEVQQFMTELAAMMNQTALPDDISDLSEEISALTSKLIVSVGEVQTVDEQPAEQTEQLEQTAVQIVPQEAQAQSSDVTTVNQEQTAAVQPEVAEEAVKFTVQPGSQEQKPQTEASSVQAAQHEAKQTAVPEAAVQGAENTGAQNEAQADPGQSGQQYGAQDIQPVQTSQVKQTAPQEDVKLNSFEVRTSEKPEEAPQQVDQEQPDIFTGHMAQRSRVVFKSDELEAIKSGGEKSGDDTAQVTAQPHAALAESPVAFTRQDGSEITVKPSEVAQQVAGKITERAADLKEGDVEYSITLEPEDLGRITVRMTKTADGTVSVSVAAENSKTMKIIEDNGSAIQDSLKQNGVQLENWQTVSESRQEAQAQDYQGSSKNPYRESENHRQDDDDDDKSFAEIIASM